MRLPRGSVARIASRVPDTALSAPLRTMRNGQYAATVVAILQSMHWHIPRSGPAFSFSTVCGAGHCSHHLLRSHHATDLARGCPGRNRAGSREDEPGSFRQVERARGAGSRMHHRRCCRSHWSLRLQRHDGDGGCRICRAGPAIGLPLSSADLSPVAASARPSCRYCCILHSDIRCRRVQHGGPTAAMLLIARKVMYSDRNNRPAQPFQSTLVPLVKRHGIACRANCNASGG